MNIPMKALAVFDRRESAWLSEKLIDDGTLDCQLADVEDFLLDINKFDSALLREDGSTCDVVLLDSALPSAFLTTMVLRLREKAPALPVLLLPQLHTQLEKNSGLAQTLQNTLNPSPASHAVANAIRYARNRERLQRKLLQAALNDDLTGLYNRRGFRQLAKQHLRLARNMKQQLLLFFADLDGLKQINDRFGHRAGDEALVLAAGAFKKTFRKSDISARLGGDEFVALVMEEPNRDSEQLRRRLLNNLHKYASKEQRYSLSLSVGVARIDPSANVPLHTMLAKLMTQADAAMYMQKRLAKTAVNADKVNAKTDTLPLPQIKTTKLVKRPVVPVRDEAIDRTVADINGREKWRPSVFAERA